MLLERYFASTSQTSEQNVRRRFSEFEDEQVRKYAGDGKNVDWEQVAKHVHGRTARQCKERWQNYLDPEINNGKWSPEEDSILLEKYSQFGPKWVCIAQFFRNRTDTNVKNRWVSLMRKTNNEDDVPMVQKGIRSAKLVAPLFVFNAQNK